MKRKVLAFILGMILIMTFIPVYAEGESAETQVSEPVQTPAPKPAAPDPTKAPAPTEAPKAEAPKAEDPAENASAEQQKPAGEPTGVPTSAPTQEPFKAKVKIELKNKGQIYFGDKVTIQVKVKEANAAYTVRWEYYNKDADVEHGEDPWVQIYKGEKYEFKVNEENAVLTYRIWVNDMLVAKEYKLPDVKVKPTEAPEEPEESEETEEPAEEPEESVEEPEETEDPVEDAEEPAEEPEESVEEPEETEENEEPAEETEEAPVLDPDRSIEVRVEWEGEELHYGDTITLVAEMNGYDNVDYVLQWQTSETGENWVDMPGETADRLEMVVTEDNSQNYWRVIAVVTGVLPEE